MSFEFDGCKDAGCFFGMEYGCRVRVESHHGQAGSVVFPDSIFSGIDDGPVTEMDAVEITDGQYQPFRYRVERSNCIVYLHALYSKLLARIVQSPLLPDLIHGFHYGKGFGQGHYIALHFLVSDAFCDFNSLVVIAVAFERFF